MPLRNPQQSLGHTGNASPSEMCRVKGEHKQTLSSERVSLRDPQNNTRAAPGQTLWVCTKSPDVLQGPTWSQQLRSVFKRKPDLHPPRAAASAILLLLLTKRLGRDGTHACTYRQVRTKPSFVPWRERPLSWLTKESTWQAFASGNFKKTLQSTCTFKSGNLESEAAAAVTQSGSYLHFLGFKHLGYLIEQHNSCGHRNA